MSACMHACTAAEQLQRPYSTLYTVSLIQFKDGFINHFS